MHFACSCVTRGKEIICPLNGCSGMYMHQQYTNVKVHDHVQSALRTLTTEQFTNKMKVLPITILSKIANV